MIPRSLSATSVAAYETCPARWKAEYLEKAPGQGGAAANLGTACHATLERWVLDGHWQGGYTEAKMLDVMAKLYDAAYYESFSSDVRYAEGLELVIKWARRTNLDVPGRTILHAETKKNFELTTSAGTIPFNYIWDRVDRIQTPTGFDIEVTDYKTWLMPVGPDVMAHKHQPRFYALAAQLEFPQAERIWVTYDQLRHDPVGMVFSTEQNRNTWRYLKSVAERIIADDGTREVLNADCRWCLRRHACRTLLDHQAVGGPLAITDVHQAAQRRASYAAAAAALTKMVEDMDEVILDYCEANDLLEFEAGAWRVEITASRRRQPVDGEMASRIIGPELVAARTKLGVTEIDKLLKSDKLTTDQKSQLRQLVRYQWGDAKVNTKALSPLDDES